ncbi:hypothetical protein SS50377_25978 [Spironucleus salmonicida]|uniref:Uncharacterized protein n=1 Tax=Spironucleus salmonicida TaxID=348837 RepID=V6LFC8_9EUKA|nr:hypothetical protein SS50377_25978 [Spironucleus salmonicida]|eukprot:EST43235.1 Hypothetical protein SS50377_17100 [Spironucleus salmonicida]
MFSMLLAAYLPLIQLEDCFLPTQLIVNPSARTIIVNLKPQASNLACSVIEKGVQFDLILKTATAEYKPVFSRTKTFQFGETNIFEFSSTERLEPVTIAILTLNSMTHFTKVQIGSIQQDTSVPNNCFDNVLLNLTEHVVLVMRPTGVCNFLSKGTVTEVQVPQLHLRKHRDSTNGSVFLAGFSDITGEIQVEFEDKINFHEIKDGLSPITQAHLQIEIKDVEYVVKDVVDQIVGSKFGQFGTNFTAITDGDTVLIFFAPIYSVIDQIRALQLTNFVIQLELIKNHTHGQMIVSYNNIDQFLDQMVFHCSDSCYEDLGSFDNIQINIIGIKNSQIHIFSNNTVESFRLSIFHTGQIRFMGRYLQLIMDQYRPTEYSTFTGQEIVTISITMDVVGQEKVSFQTPDIMLSPIIQYVNLPCIDQPCFQIRNQMIKELPKSITVKFFRNGQTVPFDMMVLRYSSQMEIDYVNFITIISIQVNVAIICASIQLYIDIKCKKASRKQRIMKKPEIDDVM